MRVRSESELLKIEVRKKIIEEIQGQENRTRKAEAYRRYLCYKDRTSDYVLDQLIKQFDLATVVEMLYAVSNISIVRKVIDKLARVYSNGVDRTISGDETATKNLQELANAIDIQSEMKRTNRFLKLQKNLALFIKPCPIYDRDGKVEKWAIQPEALNPFHYDVVEQYYDRTKPLCFILSSYQPEYRMGDQLNRPQVATLVPTAATSAKGDGVDQKIADKPADQGASDKKTYIFWSKNYHFTCDEYGEIIPDPTNPKHLNPFGVEMIINFAIDQDGSFWAEGGKDLIDGAVLLNAAISHTEHVGVSQGYGQFYMTGENLPTQVKVGPTHVIRAEYKKDEQAEPKFGFLNANPELDSLRGIVEMYLALLLTTNNLSTSGVQMQLSGTGSLASGVALIIDKAESLEDVQDQEALFVKKEPQIWKAVNAIIKVYGSQLDESISNKKLPDNFEKNFNVKFHDSPVIMSEKEKLEAMKLRQELGLDTMVTLIMKDDPTLTKDQAEEKLKELLEQRLKQKMMEMEMSAKMGVEYDDPNADPNAKPEDDPNADPTKAGETVVTDPNADKAATAGSQATDPNVQQLSLNGAQVTAMVDIVAKVVSGELPRESGVQLIATSFNISLPDAEKILGTAGKGFKAPTPEPQPAPIVGAPIEGDKGNDN